MFKQEEGEEDRQLRERVRDRGVGGELERRVVGGVKNKKKQDCAN